MGWDPSLETGDPMIDGQHRDLFDALERLGQLEAADESAAVRETLDALAEYVGVHFTLEEELMRREDYPPGEIERHAVEHRKLTERTRDMILEYRTGEVDSIRPVCEFLADWLDHHVNEMDRLLVDHVRGRAR